MKIETKSAGLQRALKSLNISPIGFVPTMGALHKGHLSLVENAIQLCPVIVVSIFVNPTQFNDKNDLKNYPRTPERDLELLGSVLRNDDLVFLPDVEEIYPEEDTRVFHFGNPGKVMEALHRPGHFNGVAQVVSRLFDIVKPDIAVFGLKDFQQLAIIKSLVKQTGNQVNIVGHPIVRENDGLAMSSRNVLLEKENRSRAPVIFKSLKQASTMLKDHDISEIKSFISDSINKIPEFSLEYFEIVDDTELVPVKAKIEMTRDRKYFGCIAVKVGRIRLIDNIEIELV